MARSNRISTSQRFGRRIRALRKLRGMTQERLAVRSGVSTKFIGEIERGLANPSLDVLDRLARAFNLPSCELLRFEGSADERSESATGRTGIGYLVGERILAYVKGRKGEDLERAMRILEAALGDPPKGR